MSDILDLKYKQLRDSLRGLKNLLVAFSGGVDSTLLLKIAHDILGNNVIAATADSPSLPRKELEGCRESARRIGVRHLTIHTNEIKNKNYAKNPLNRCYHCKTELYSNLRDLSKKLKIENIANGTNNDDLRDYRPGLEAAEEFKVLSPLKNLTKRDVRELARAFDLPHWNKPSSPCLSSRIPYNNLITVKKLSMVEKGESILKALGIDELRVRHRGNTASIEVLKKDFNIIRGSFDDLQRQFQTLGFKEISLDIFRSGRLNEEIYGREAN